MRAGLASCGRIMYHQDFRAPCLPRFFHVYQSRHRRIFSHMIDQWFPLGHFTMRYIIPILFVAATFLVGCQSPPVTSNQTAAAPPTFRPMFVTTLGTNTTADGTWRIAVSDTSLDLSRSIGYGDGKGFKMSGWSTTTIPAPTKQAVGWTTTHQGWFVFAESESRVWAYDGDRLLVLHTYASSGNNSHEAIYYSGNLPCTVPTEVFSRLTERTQRDIQTHE